MPEINVKVPGDSFYPQYGRVTEEPVGAGALVKGRLYTKAAGTDNLIAVPTTGLINGIFQSQADVPAHTVPGTYTVLAYGAGSRVGLTASANLTVGQLVKWNTSDSKVELFAIVGANPTAAEYAGKVGRIFEIYSETEIATKKSKTVDDDIVIVELGQG